MHVCVYICFRVMRGARVCLLSIACVFFYTSSVLKYSLCVYILASLVTLYNAWLDDLAPTASSIETTVVRRDKICRAILWYAKKSKMLETLEEAFPASLKMAHLLR